MEAIPPPAPIAAVVDRIPANCPSKNSQWMPSSDRKNPNAATALAMVRLPPHIAPAALHPINAASARISLDPYPMALYGSFSERIKYASNAALVSDRTSAIVIPIRTPAGMDIDFLLFTSLSPFTAMYVHRHKKRTGRFLPVLSN